MNSLGQGGGLPDEAGMASILFTSNVLMTLAYFSLSFLVIHVLHKRPDVPFRGLFMLFSLCILGRGLTHILSIVSLWWEVPVLLAGCSYAPAWFWYISPTGFGMSCPPYLRIPSPQQWDATNRQLQHEVAGHKKTHEELEALNRELEARVRSRTEELETTLAEIKRLQGTVTTICAWTKRIKDHGEWISFEEFMGKHFGFQFTHGISEEALAELKKEVPSIAKDLRRITQPVPKLPPHPELPL